MKLLFTALAICFTMHLSAQTAADSVKATINTLFTAMRNADPVSLKSVFADGAVLQTVSRDREGNTVVRTDGIDDFANSIGGLKKDSADERIEFESIKIDGSLAMAWTPYQFYFNGKFSHCGVNSFQLVRFRDGWKIQYIIDTRRRTGCNP
jgi:hypothetical protein